MIPLVLSLVPELFPMFGEVVIVQLNGFVSESWIVILSEEVVIDIPVDSFVGLGLEIVGGLFTGGVCVVNV